MLRHGRSQLRRSELTRRVRDRVLRAVARRVLPSSAERDRGHRDRRSRLEVVRRADHSAGAACRGRSVLRRQHLLLAGTAVRDAGGGSLPVRRAWTAQSGMGRPYIAEIWDKTAHRGQIRARGQNRRDPDRGNPALRPAPVHVGRGHRLDVVDDACVRHRPGGRPHLRAQHARRVRCRRHRDRAGGDRPAPRQPAEPQAPGTQHPAVPDQIRCSTRSSWPSRCGSVLIGWMVAGPRGRGTGTHAVPAPRRRGGPRSGRPVPPPPCGCGTGRCSCAASCARQWRYSCR
jgi:hypothetical protein